ncbi:MAG: hypothetical protein FWF72_00305 [Paludibacter sp.]|nr:hypothetical protein [Paludibacter sp.]
MKVLLVILSVYVLLLSAMPCHCNGHGSLSGIADEQTAIVAQDADTHADTDTCTPFCTCASSCHSATLFSKIFAVTFPFISSTPIVSFYQANNGITVPLDFWRPPQA